MAGSRRMRSAPTEQEILEFQRNSLQRHAIDLGEWISRASNQRARNLGHPNLRPAHARLMAFLDWEGSRITDIARAQDVSKNAVGQLVSELEGLGYVERVADPHDARAKIVRYTKLGRALIADARSIGAELDAQIEGILGTDRFAEFRRSLRDIVEGIAAGGSPGDRV